MKPRRIQLWSNLTNDLPGLLYLTPIKKRDKDIMLDFRNCQYVDSSGLNLLLIRILKMVESQNKDQLRWRIKLPEEENVLKKMVKLGFLKIIDEKIPNKDLFWPEHLSDIRIDKLNQYGLNFERLTSIPIYTLSFGENRRDKLTDFTSWFYELARRNLSQQNYRINQLILILKEIAKNTADHTKSDAFCGVDFIKSDNNMTKINFSIGDLGQGILLEVRDHLYDINHPRRNKFDNVEMYRFAFDFGNTTSQKTESINAGVGMPTIINGSRPIGLRIKVYDGRSCGYLNKIDEITHGSLRENFHHLGHSVGFYYYGELTLRNE